jgi:hypothetical protein
METKICKTCGIEKSIDEFYSQIMISKTKGEYIRFNLNCKKCVVDKSQKWIELNPKRYKELILRRDRTREPYFKELSRTRVKNGKYRKWQQDNPEKIKQYSLDREKHKKHKISKKEWEACLDYFNNCCAYCGLPNEEYFTTYRGVTKRGNFHKEHVDFEGANDLSNCVPSCKYCNSEKNTLRFDDWYNKDNVKFTQERFDKIHKWINEDYKIHIKIHNNRII